MLGYEILPLPYFPQIIPPTPLISPITGALEEMNVSDYPSIIRYEKKESAISYPEQMLINNSKKFDLFTKPSQ